MAGLGYPFWPDIGIPCDIPDLHGLALDLRDHPFSFAFSQRRRPQYFSEEGPWASTPWLRCMYSLEAGIILRIDHVMGDGGGSMVDAVTYIYLG